MSDDQEDKYGNPINGDRLIYCCFPDCGCDGARLCMAENGASKRALDGNIEGMRHSHPTPQMSRARVKLALEVWDEERAKKEPKP